MGSETCRDVLTQVLSASSAAAAALEGTLDDDDVAGARTQLTRIERTITMIVLSRPVLERAALPMATVIKTLDAIHLASVMLCRERQRIALAFATHDPQQACAARALGFDCVGV